MGAGCGPEAIGVNLGTVPGKPGAFPTTEKHRLCQEADEAYISAARANVIA